MLEEQDPPILLPMQEENAPRATAPSRAQMAAERGSYLIVVARDQPDLLRHLKQRLAGFDGVEVVLDRRQGGRWQWSESCYYQERGADRRLPSNGPADLGNRSFLIVPRHVLGSRS